VFLHFAETGLEEAGSSLLRRVVQARGERRKRSGKFVISGIGRAVKAHRKARMGRNPATGKAIKSKAKTVVRLRAAKAFKDAVLK
jgi:DNA-binding protein HU-beta